MSYAPTSRGKEEDEIEQNIINILEEPTKMPKIEHKSPEPMPESKKDKIAQPNKQINNILLH